MKTTVKILKTLLLLFMATTLMGMVSCSAEDGRDGADGIDGVDGAQGPQGDQGDPGDDGDDGISNIEVSEWFPIDFDFISGTTELGRMYIEIPEMVQFVEDGGLVIMYFREMDANIQQAVITPLPYQIDPLSLSYLYGDFTDIFGHIGITFMANYPNGHVGVLEHEDLSLQYIMIPTSSRTTVDFTKMSYEEVMDYFDIDF